MTDDFLTLAAAYRTEYLLKTEALYTANRTGWFADFTGHFSEICTRIQKWQHESALPAIMYMEYTMLYTNFKNRRYNAEVFVYGENSYLDKSQRWVGEYDVSFLFVYFDELWDKLLSVRKRYVGKVTAREIAVFMLRALPEFYSYLVVVARSAIVELVGKSQLADIEKNDRFKINVGDYMGNTETVFTECKNKDADKLDGWFSEQLPDKYNFGDYSGLDFSGKSFYYTDIRFARFQNSILNHTVFDCCILIGSNFRKADMESSRLDNCFISESDFSYANLKNASFVNVFGRAGLPNENEWRYVGFLPVNFRHADLTGVDFTGANLNGADYTGAILDGADFTGAILDGALFDNECYNKK